MNILILNWRDPKNPKAGGAEYVTFEHAKAWVKKGHSVTWFTTSFGNAQEKEVSEGVTFIRRGNQLSVFFQAYFFYKQSKNQFSVIVDEVHGLPFFTPLYVRKPVIVFIHEVAQEIWDFTYVFPFNLLGKFLERKSLQLYKNHRFWTDATATIDDLEKIGISKKNCIAIPCPISNKSLHMPAEKELDPTFIFVGRLVTMKGIEDVIQAFTQIKKIKKNARLWIVGSGSTGYVQKLREIIKTNSLSQSVKLWGFVSEEEKLRLMRRAHILLHGSIKEGWGLVVLEAASQATPTIGYDVAGLNETVIDGKTGILVPKLQPAQMAEASLMLLDDKTSYARMQKQCLIWADSFQWSDVVGESLQLLKNEIKQ